MTIGKITDSQQDMVFIEARVETGEHIETVEGGNLWSEDIIGTFGVEFTAAHYFGRVLIPIADGRDQDVVVRLYKIGESGIQDKELIHETLFKGIKLDAVLHVIFEPLSPGEYYWEACTTTQVIRPYTVNGSTYQRSWVNGSPVTGYDFRSKIMYHTDEPQELPVAITGDLVDNGEATVEGTGLAAVQVGAVEKNVARELDPLSNGGHILTGSWYLENGR